MTLLNKIFWQKIISAMMIFTIFMTINAPVVYAKGFFSFGEDEEIATELPSISREKIVAILVEEELLSDDILKTRIERYAMDVQNELIARSILIPVPPEASPKEIQEGLAQFYFSGYKNDDLSQLIGTILIGDVPIPVVDKKGGLYPTIFPYTDFENVNYEWNDESQRFIWKLGDNEPEVWHGLIKSDAESADGRIYELQKYFEKNHQVHEGKVNYAKRVFFADFYRQRKGINEKQKKFYENWINNLGDSVYLRFNKHWLKDLTEQEIGVVPQKLLPASAQGISQEMDFSEMPDVFAKNPIETMSMRYLSANENLLTQINEQVEVAGRWSSSDIETTISLLSKKDEWAMNVIKDATDEIEEIFVAKSREKNIAANITIPLQEVVPYVEDLVPKIKLFPNKWLGIKMDELKRWNWRTNKLDDPAPEYPAENCSLYRGTVRDDDNPIAQKVEISRVFDPQLFDKNPDDRCMGKVEGEEIKYSECRFSDYIDDMNSGFEIIGWNDVDFPVFSYAGGKEVFDMKYDGASGCAPIILELQPDAIEDAVGAKDSFSSLVFHNEPTLETIQAAIKNTTATDMPIDIHHGISFYSTANDEDYFFYRISFPSAFDLINKRDELDDDFDLLTKDELELNLNNTINEINQTAGNSAKFEESFFADTYWLDEDKQIELIEAIKWLGEDLEQKNIEMFTGALSKSSTAREVLRQDDYDGYELIEIRGDLSDVLPEGGIKVAFERGETEPSVAFVDAKNEAEIAFSSGLSNGVDTKLQKEFEDIFAENNTSPECFGVNLLKWPTKCFAPWVAELPTIFTKMTKLVPNINLNLSEEEKAEEDRNPAKNNKSAFKLVSINNEDNSLTKIIAKPEKLKISNTDTSFQDVVVSLKDINGEILNTDYKTEVEIIAGNSDLDKFFSVFPSKKITVKKGQATFNLLPKKQRDGGIVKFSFKAGNLNSNTVSINVSNKKIEAFIDESELVAGDRLGTSVQAKILNRKGDIDHNFDGKIMAFSSDEGAFHSDDFSGDRAKIKNGVAEILFFPGTISGEAKISVQDEEKLLPLNEIFLDIIPTDPAEIVFTYFPDKLVVDGQPLEYFAEIADKYGNIIPELKGKIKKWGNDASNTDNKGLNKEEVSLPKEKIKNISLFKKFIDLFKDNTKTTKESSYNMKLDYRGKIEDLKTKKDNQERIDQDDSKRRTKSLFEKLETNSLSSLLDIKNSKQKDDIKITKNPGGINKFSNLNKKNKESNIKEANALDSSLKSREILEKSSNIDIKINNFEDVKKVINKKSKKEIAEERNKLMTEALEKGIQKLILTAEVKLKNGEIIELENTHEIPIAVLPHFELDIPDIDLIAGQVNSFPVKIIAKTEEGEILKNDFSAEVISDNDLIGKVDKEIIFKKGVANLNIFAGFKSGKVNIKIKAKGFLQKVFAIKVLSAEPNQIKIISDHTDINADAKNPLNIQIEVWDKYGNIADFNDKINFTINPQDILTNTAQDIKDLGIFSNPATADEFVENQQVEDNELPEPVISLEAVTISMNKGIGENKIYTKGIGGESYLMATSEDLIPGTIELDTTKVLAVSDFKYLSPKSIFTLLLGFAGGDLNKKNIGNRFLFDGETQAVATHITTESTHKVFGHIFSNYNISEELIPKIFEGNQLKILLNNLIEVTVVFEKNPKIFLGKKNITEEGIYFTPEKELESSDFDLKSREIFYKDNSLFKISNSGGVSINNSKIEFKSVNNSLLKWGIYLEDEFLGELYLNAVNAEIITLSAGESLPEGENIILINSLKNDVILSEVFNGKTTTEKKGFAIVSKIEKEEKSKLLGSANFNSKDKKLGWMTKWKGGTFFAGNNSIGNSNKWGSPDSFILLGDPSLSLRKDNEKSELAITKDIGTPLWQSPIGVIDDIISGDINYDNRSEIFIRSKNKLFALYQDKNQLDNFRDIGEILRFGDGVKEVASYNKENGDLLYIIQLNSKGDLIFHHNVNGVLSREKIDLGIKNPLEKIVVGKMNSDEFKDLVLLDDSNNLYISYGRSGGFYSAQKLDSLAAGFEKISEQYVTTDGQDINNKIFNSDKFKNLNNFFAGFDNAINESWTGEVKKVEDIDFLRVTENKAFNIRFEMENNGESNLVENNSKFIQKLIIYSKNKDLNNFQLIVPFFAGFELEKDSFSFSGCIGSPKIKKQTDSFIISGCNINKAHLVKISWELKAKEIPLINFMVDDFEGNDGVDDISVPWKIDGKKKFIQYLSHGDLKAYPQNPAKKTKDAPESPIVKIFTKKIVDAYPEGSTFPIEDFDAVASAEDMFDCMKNTDNGLPDFYKPKNLADLIASMTTQPSLQVQNAIDMIRAFVPSIAFLAPGPQSIYIPPFSFPNPLPSGGTPTLAVTIATPPYFSVFTPNMSMLNSISNFRLYLMPTTTLRIGIGLCFGPLMDPFMTPTGIPFPPQCFVIVPPLLPSNNGSGNTGSGESEQCSFENPANSSAVNIAKNNFLLNAFVSGVGSSASFGSFTPKAGSYSKNLQIFPPDIITTWVRAQMREFSNFKFPRFDIILPKFPKLGIGGKDMEPLERISQSPYFEIKRKKLEINYPNFSKEDFKKLKEDFKNWKKDIVNKKDDLKKQLDELENPSFEELKAEIERNGEEIRKSIVEEIDTVITKIEVKIKKIKQSILEIKNIIQTKLKESDNGADGGLSDEEKKKLELQLSELKDLEKIEKTIDVELKKTKNKKIEIENELTEKIDELKKLPKELADSAKNKLKKQLDELEKIESMVNKNMKAIESYKEEIKKLKELPKKIKKAIKELSKINDVIKEYWVTWIEKNKKSAREWKNFAKKTTAIIDTWNEIPKIFKDFTEGSTPGGGGSTTSVNRGTLITWLMKMLLSAIKLPVIPMPQFPDTKIDLSDVKIGVSVNIPELSFKPVDTSLPGLPGLDIGLDLVSQVSSLSKNMSEGFFDQIKGSLNITVNTALGLPTGVGVTLPDVGYLNSIMGSLQAVNSSFDSIQGITQALSTDLPKNIIESIPVISIPVFVLPPIPQIVPEVIIPTINLPQLPTLLPPPIFPNFLQPIMTVIAVIKPFFETILAGLSMGIIPIPEWKVASRVVQLTNRTGLLPMDFVFSAQIPSLPKIAIPPIVIKPKVNLVPAFEELNYSITSLAQIMNSITDMMSNLSKGGIPDVQDLVKPLSIHDNDSKNSVAISIYDQVEESDKINNSSVIARIREITKSTNEVNLTFNKQKEKSYLEKTLAPYKGLLSSLEYISSSDTPDNLPNSFDTEKYDTTKLEPEPIDTLYYFSPEKDSAESIITFPINNKIHNLLIADLDEDGKEELLYSIDNQLFLKRRISKNLTENEINNKYKVSTNLLYQDFAEFSSYFSASREIKLNTSTLESQLNFLPTKNEEVSYFEWVISERPDRLFEYNKNSNKKESKTWKRIGFLVRPKGNKYQIRKGMAEIQKIKGAPILYGNALNKIDKVDADDCKKGNIIKPFFNKETILVGIDKESRFEVLTKEREGQQQGTRNIVLREGEETVVDFAEICLTRGSIGYIDLTKVEKINPKVGDNFFSNMRFELGKNDEVELELFNNTDIVIYGGESYEFYSFNSRENFIKNIQKLSLENHYGYLVAFNKYGKRSYKYSKSFLHDPQLSDDKDKPSIILAQGNTIKVLITEKINIDASGSYDNQKISRVWWEKDGKIILDSNNKKHSATELLKIELPAENNPTKFTMKINIEDFSKNIASQDIPVIVSAPELELSEVSLRDQEISGKILEGKPNIRIGFLRERKGIKTILEKTIISEDNGRFILNNLGNRGNIILKDINTNEKLVEILPTGRPIIINSEKVKTTISTNPLVIKIKNSKNESLATINFKTNSAKNNDIKIESSFKEISAKNARNMKEINVIDRDKDDDFIWKRFNGGISLIDNLNNKTLGVLDNYGKFKSTDFLKTLRIRPKKVKEEGDPVIFQIYDGKTKKLISEFLIPVKGLIVQ